MSLYQHVPHPHIALRRAHGPTKTADQLPNETAAQRFNSKIALRVTKMVGSMWCAYVFTLLALFSLPAVLSGFAAFQGTFPAWLVKPSIIALVAWVAQTFLQLVLLSVIMVGQDVQSRAADKRAQDTYLDAEAVLHEAQQIQAHLAAQDAAIEAIAAQAGVLLGTIASGPAAGQPGGAPA